MGSFHGITLHWPFSRILYLVQYNELLKRGTPANDKGKQTSAVLAPLFRFHARLYMQDTIGVRQKQYLRICREYQHISPKQHFKETWAPNLIIRNPIADEVRK